MSLQNSWGFLEFSSADKIPFTPRDYFCLFSWNQRNKEVKTFQTPDPPAWQGLGPSCLSGGEVGGYSTPSSWRTTVATPRPCGNATATATWATGQPHQWKLNLRLRGRPGTAVSKRKILSSEEAQLGWDRSQRQLCYRAASQKKIEDSVQHWQGPVDQRCAGVPIKCLEESQRRQELCLAGSRGEGKVWVRFAWTSVECLLIWGKELGDEARFGSRI